MISGPITIRGTEYPDAAAVASAFGIKVESVRKAIRKGTQDRIGLERGPQPAAVRVRGQVFPSADAAAAHFGVSRNRIYEALHYGREDFIGLGRSRKHQVNRKPSGGMKHAIPVRIGRFSWPSIGACSQAIGMSKSYVWRKIKEGDTATIIAKAMTAKARKEGHKARLPDTADRDAKRAHSSAMLAAWRKRKADGQIEERTNT